MLVSDTIVPYKTTYTRATAYTRVRLFEHAGARTIIVTELFKNPGPSITNAASELYPFLQKTYGEDVRIVEHYPYADDESFDFVTVGRARMWKDAERADVIALIGEELAPHVRASEPAFLELANEPEPLLAEELQQRVLEGADALVSESAWLSSFAPAPQKIYQGAFDPEGRAAIIVRESAGARRLLFRCEGRAFAWGYGGAGPMQAASALLADALGLSPTAKGDVPEIARLVQAFKWEVVAKWPGDRPFSIAAADIVAWVEQRPDPIVSCTRHRIELDEGYCWKCEAESDSAVEAQQP